MGESVDLLVGGDVIYPMTDEGGIVLDGEVAIVGDRIVYVGERRPSGAWAPKRRLEDCK